MQNMLHLLTEDAGRGVRIDFDYLKAQHDPKPGVLYLGTWVNPRTNNELWCGINLHYLKSDKELEALRVIMPRVAKIQNLKEKVQKLREVMRQFAHDPESFGVEATPEHETFLLDWVNDTKFMNRAYRTYNAKYVSGIRRGDVLFLDFTKDDEEKAAEIAVKDGEDYKLLPMDDKAKYISQAIEDRPDEEEPELEPEVVEPEPLAPEPEPEPAPKKPREKKVKAKKTKPTSKRRAVKDQEPDILPKGKRSVTGRAAPPKQKARKAQLPPEPVLPPGPEEPPPAIRGQKRVKARKVAPRGKGPAIKGFVPPTEQVPPPAVDPGHIPPRTAFQRPGVQRPPANPIDQDAARRGLTSPQKRKATKKPPTPPPQEPEE
jgi:hypothetical protein